MGLPYTPLEELDRVLKDFFKKGPAYASYKFQALFQAAMYVETVVYVDERLMRTTGSMIAKSVSWESCKLACTLVLLFASPPSAFMLKTLTWQSRNLDGFPTMAEISSTPSVDLPKRFAQAKKAAIDGKVGKVTVLGVSLIDVEIIERAEVGRNDVDFDFTSFTHSFALAIGREGFRVYQSWGEHGYRLDQFLTRGGSRIRSWEEGKAFMKAFKKLASATKWSPELNSAYKELFEVDIDSICGEWRVQPPLIPVYRPWVRVFEINDVQVNHIKKFTWKIIE
ncbi:hypothetical protein TSTA_002850 [Talaromyces stipitatus ATCC 10500]|uniref:Uncharacterized protein n=1 Tax=Talaromyces stipitatus (strain ATCC 10500 / CBS 375.48 / QM 6759 / NRRL 1006) TaxID=441959 RepID=B8MS88_TALSN|nr:uncharacterized protein TSTA_002850 [Talaromyces stipitatus ATCC 10500]EED12221.1 hypothetical protein TSTA_002850 [Talaromyces stipitatus ATCC 10500]